MTAPLLCLHGFAGSPQLFGAFAKCLAGHATVMRPWLPGHGGKPAPESAMGYEEAALAWFDTLELPRSQRWTLVAYSMGARLALPLLERRAASFEAALLVGCHPGLRSGEERATRRKADRAWQTLLRDRGVERFAGDWERQAIFASQLGLGEDLLVAQRAWRRAHEADGLARALQVFGLGEMPDYAGLLRSPPCPLRLVVGERDAKFRSLLEECLGTSELHRLSIVSGCGHNPLLEHPASLARLVEGAV